MDPFNEPSGDDIGDSGVVADRSESSSEFDDLSEDVVDWGDAEVFGNMSGAL